MRDNWPALAVMMPSASGHVGAGEVAWIEIFPKPMFERCCLSPRGWHLLSLVVTTLARGML